MNCVICGKKLAVFASVKGLTILKCPRCGFGQTKGLSSHTHEYHRDETYIEEERLFKNIFEKRVSKIIKIKKVGSALEVGCSTGLMLSLLKAKGWQVKGIEVSKKAAEIARERGIEIDVKDFFKFGNSEKFDLIIFNHTLEHLENPTKAVEKARSLLKSKGLLYIDLPNFGGSSAKLQKGKWPLLLPEEHLWHFTLESLSLLLKKFNMKVVFTERASGIWDYKRPIRGTLNSLLHFKKRFFKEFITSLPTLLITKKGQGSDLMVISKKV
jgi:SAM-dependent methyltransferase